MACCCLSVLHCTDSDNNSARLHARLERDVFWGLRHADLKRLVIGTFKLMDWQLPNGAHTSAPHATDYQRYAQALRDAANDQGADMAPLRDLYADM